MPEPKPIALTLIGQYLEAGQLDAASTLIQQALSCVQDDEIALLASEQLDAGDIMGFSQTLYQQLFALLLHPQLNLVFETVRAFLYLKGGIAILQDLCGKPQPMAHQHLETAGQHLDATTRNMVHLILLTPSSSIAFGDQGQNLLAHTPALYAFEFLTSLATIDTVLDVAGTQFRDNCFQTIRPSFQAMGNDLRAACTLKHAVLLWGKCIYIADQNLKQQLKTYLNRVLYDYARYAKIRPAAVKYRSTAKPKLTIVAEFYEPHHVLYACYQGILQPLFDYFDVTLAADANATEDPLIAEQYPKRITLEPDNMKQICLALQKSQPDMIFYLSIGSTKWGPLFANLRLAPVQACTLGIPDSSFSPAIDYNIMAANMAPSLTTDVSALFSERVAAIHTPSQQVLQFHPRAPDTLPSVTIRQTTEICHIAILGAYLKLNAPFMTALQALAQQATQAIHLHFFPNLSGLRRAAFQTTIQRLLPDTPCTIHPSAPTRDYLAWLNTCDLGLSTYPFTNTNTLIDAFLVGVPTISLAGERPLERTDYYLHVITQTVEHCCVTDYASAVSALLNLMQDDTMRVELAHHVQQAVQACFQQSDDHTYFAKSLYWLYQNHLDIQQSPTRRLDCNATTLDQIGGPHLVSP